MYCLPTTVPDLSSGQDARRGYSSGAADNDGEAENVTEQHIFMPAWSRGSAEMFRDACQRCSCLSLSLLGVWTRTLEDEQAFKSSSSGKGA